MLITLAVVVTLEFLSLGSLGYSIKLIHAGHKRFHVYLRTRRD